MISTAVTSDSEPLPIGSDLKLEFPVKEDLSFIDIFPEPRKQTKKLSKLRITVIGGGPAGLLFARDAGFNGADVTVLEKAADPRGSVPGYTDRSFNITLENVGRFALGDSSNWLGGTRVVGRALHNFHNTSDVKYTRYGENPDDDLISIPRPVLRQHMVNQAIEMGAKIKFESRVIDIEPDEGIVWFTDYTGKDQTMTSDLIVVADGLHSIGDKHLLNIPGAQRYFKPETRSCVTSLIRPSKRTPLSTHHIHFWHEPTLDTFTIGVPNADGSIGLIVASPFADIDPESHPFATVRKAKKRLKRDFPHLYKQCPELAKDLPTRTKYNFYYKAVSTFIIGKKSVLVGDAACVMPVWAAFGANYAMYSASSLVFQLVNQSGKISSALDIYQKQQRILTRSVLEYVRDQGDFLSGPVTISPDDRSATSLAPLIKAARQKDDT